MQIGTSRAIKTIAAFCLLLPLTTIACSSEPPQKLPANRQAWLEEANAKCIEIGASAPAPADLTDLEVLSEQAAELADVTEDVVNALQDIPAPKDGSGIPNTALDALAQVPGAYREVAEAAASGDAAATATVLEDNLEILTNAEQLALEVGLDSCAQLGVDN